MAGSITPPGRPSDAQLANPAIAKNWKAAQDFEAMALGQLLAPMFSTVNNAKGPFGGGAAEETWRPMLSQELGKHLATNGGLGLAAPIFQQMLRMQEAADQARTASPEQETP